MNLISGCHAFFWFDIAVRPRNAVNNKKCSKTRNVTFEPETLVQAEKLEYIVYIRVYM